MNYRREIDGLRAVAVVSVMLFHAGFQVFGGGFIGVDVFFVISGYLITTIILTQLAQDKFSIVHFYERRARRILPALFLVLFISSLLAWRWLLPGDMKDYSQSLIAVSLFMSNMFFWHKSGYFDMDADLKPLLHTWSLGVEEQYYLLFPVFLLLVWRFGRRWTFPLLVFLCLSSLAVAQWAALNKPYAAFYLLLTRGWELLIGSLSAFYLFKKQRLAISRWWREAGGWLGLAFIFYAIFAYSSTTPFPGFYALLPTVGTVLIILCATPDNWIGRLIGNKLCVAIGLISYSAYLWHQPIFAFARHASLQPPSNLKLSILFILSFILAYVSWRYVEKPFRDPFKFSRKQIFIFAAIGSVSFIVFGLAGHIHQGYEQRFGGRLAYIEKARLNKNPHQDGCIFSSSDFPSPEKYCHLGKGPVIGILFGDSHADALSYPFSQALSRKGVRFLSIAYSGCPPIENVYRVDMKTDHRCYEFNRQTYDYVLHNPDIKNIILLGRWTVYYEGTYFDNEQGGVESRDVIGLDTVSSQGVKLHHAQTERKVQVRTQYLASIRRLLQAGKQVFLIYPVPEVGFDVPGYKGKAELISGTKYQITTDYQLYLKRNKAVIDAFDSLGDVPNLVRIRPDHLLCDSVVKKRCVTEINNKILYFDDDHLSNDGAELVVAEIAKRLKAE